MSKKQENPNQIIRKDGKSVFVEALRNAFAIGKVQLKFISYNQNQNAGNRIQSSIDIYFSFAAFLRIANDVINGTMYHKLQHLKTNAENGSNRIVLYQGGTPAAALNASGKGRNDGKALARRLSVSAGDKLPFLFLAESGPGESIQKGLIVPRWGNSPEQRVSVAMTADDVKEFFLLIKEEITAYLTYKNMENNLNMQKDVLLLMAHSMGLDTSEIEQKYAPPQFNSENSKKNDNYADYQGSAYKSSYKGDTNHQETSSYNSEYNAYAANNQQYNRGQMPLENTVRNNPSPQYSNRSNITYKQNPAYNSNSHPHSMANSSMRSTGAAPAGNKQQNIYMEQQNMFNDMFRYATS